MKKLTSFVLALAMAAVCAAPAMATETTGGTTQPGNSGTTTSSDKTITQDSTTQSDGTTVTFTIDPAYTVTIPQTIELDKITDTTKTTVTYEKDLTLTASNVRLKNNQTLKVSIPTDPDTFKLTSGESATLGYTITIGAIGENSTPVPADGVVAIFTTQTADQSVTLHIEAADPPFAGEYSGTLNFTIALDPKDNT